jgi:hypothetical protein
MFIIIIIILKLIDQNHSKIKHVRNVLVTI